MQEPTLELHPPRLYVHMLLPDLPDSTSATIPSQSIVVSSTDTVSDVRKALIQSLFPSETLEGRSYRVWKFDEPPPAATHLTVKTVQESRVSILEDSSKKVDEALIENGDVFAVEVAVDGKWIVSENEKAGSSEWSSLATDALPPTPQSTQGETEAPKPLFGSGADFFSKLQTKAALTPLTGALTATPAKPPKAGPSKDPRPGPKVCTLVPGKLGLGNM